MKLFMENSYQQLESIRADFAGDQDLVRLKGWFKLTKTNQGLCDVLLLHDRELEHEVQEWIGQRSTFELIMSRYKQFDHYLEEIGSPDHFAARVVSGHGAISSGQNIFLFFPDCFQLTGAKKEHFFGVELIDVWSNIFHRVIFPCVRKIFTYETQLNLLTKLAINLDKTIYLASIFHEVGHRVGSWKVSPQRDSRLNVCEFYTDIFGELSTDCLLVSHLSEFPELAIFVILQRIFWFGRRGFLEDPYSGKINLDNDSWLSGFIWNRLRICRALELFGGRWSFNLELAVMEINRILLEIDILGKEIIHENSIENQNRHVLDWMKEQVQFVDGVGFIFSEELRNVYSQCSDLPEIPHFDPLIERVAHSVVS